MIADAKYLSSLKQPRLTAFGWQEPENEKDRRSFHDILTTGCTIPMIYDDKAEPGAPYDFIYTTGFFLNLGHPEFFIKGALDESAADMMNALFRYVEAGNQIGDGDSVRHDLGKGEICFIAKTFPHDRYFDYLGWGCWFYRSLFYKQPPVLEHKFPVLQLFYPDRIGKYPWDEGCDPGVLKMQTL